MLISVYSKIDDHGFVIMPVAQSHQSSKSSSVAGDANHSECAAHNAAQEHAHFDRDLPLTGAFSGAATSKDIYEHRFTSKRVIARYVFTTLFSILLTLGCFEAVARTVVWLGRPTNFSTKIYDAKYYEATCPRDTSLARLYFLGTSHIANGVYAELITEKLKKNGYKLQVCNLGVPWGFPQDELLLLREAIAHGGKPAAVILEMDQTGFISKNGNYNFSQEFLDSNMGYLVAPRKNVLDELKYRLSNYSFLFRYRAYLGQTLTLSRNTVLGTAWNNTSTDAVNRETSLQGWAPLYPCVTPEKLQSSLEQREKLQKKYFSWAIPIDKNIRNGNILPVYEFCKSNHIPLILLRMPVTAEYNQVFCRTLQVSQEHFENVFCKQSEIYNAPVLDFSHDNDLTHFCD